MLEPDYKSSCQSINCFVKDICFLEQKIPYLLMRCLILISQTKICMLVKLPTDLYAVSAGKGALVTA